MDRANMSGGIDKFCGSQFWDDKLTWYSNDPDFTRCFQRTVLLWIPCSFLFIFAGFDAYSSIHSKAKNINWNPLNLTKAAFTIILMILQLADLAYTFYLKSDDKQTYPVDQYTPIIKILTFGLSLFLLLFGRINGVRTSHLQFMFWFILACTEAFAFRTIVRKTSEKNENLKIEVFFYVTSIIYYPIVVALFLLNCFADAPPVYKDDTEIKEKPCPEEGASSLSRLIFFWFEGLAWKGYKNPLTNQDLWDLNNEDKTTTVFPIFNKYWQQALEKSKNKLASTPATTNASFNNKGESIEFKAKAKKGPNSSIMGPLFSAFGSTFLFGAILKLIHDLLMFVPPQVLKLLINYITGDEENWKGYFYAALIFVTAMIQTLVLAQYFHKMFLVGMRVRSSLVSTIYRKSLRISAAARKESTIGEIVNLMSVDAQRFMDLTAYLNMLWSAPLQIGLSIYFLYDHLGPSVFAGLAVMILLIPVNAVIANKIKKLQVRQMKNKDDRVKLMNEVLSGIKVLKLYAWEPSFEKQVQDIREKEINVLKETAYLNAGTSFIWTCAPFLVSVVTFAVYVLIDENNVLDAEKAFVSLTLFNIMRMPMSVLPMMIILVVQAGVSVKRVNKFLNAEEIDPKAVTQDDNEKDPVIIENGNFFWDEDTPALKNINLRVKEGSLQAIVGTVGAGKSTIFATLLGDLEKVSGRVNVKGSIAYVAQQSWIQNATLRDNILFGKPYDSVKYNKVIDACALRPDLDILPAGDQTEIGEKGINLSGGQKARVSLARATYNNADIYLFDDPLSAVDSHVGKHIFEKVLGPKGMLKKKTRILVTHGITYLSQVDNIVVMKEGEISEQGSYKELLKKKGDFAEFIEQYLDTIDEDEDQEIMLDLEGIIGSKDEILQRQRSRISESETGASEGKLMQRQSSIISQGSIKLSESPQRKLSKSAELSGSLRSKGSIIIEEKDKLIEIEKAETGSVKLSVYSYYIKAVGWIMVLLTLILHLCFQAFSVGASIWLSRWSDDNETATDTGKRDMYLGVYGGLGLGQAACILVGTLVMALGTLKAGQVLHNTMLMFILRSPMSFFDTTPLGRIVNRFSKDVDVADNTIPMNLRSWLTCLLSVLSTLTVISYSTPLFIAIIVPTFFIYFFVQRFYVATSRQLKRIESISRSPIYSHFGETITGAQSIRAYDQEKRFIAESDAKVDYNQISYFPSIVANRWLAVRLETIGNLIIFFSALFVVIGKDDIDPGLAGLSVSYALQITQTLNWLVRMTSDVESNIVAVERIKEYCEIVQEAEWEQKDKKIDKSWPEKGAVEFDHYQTRYREGLDLVLKDVTCKIEPGEKIGVVGRTGAGKSSLTLGLFRIIEAAGGKILIDGLDISKIGLHDVRSKITIIPQDPVLFSGSLRMNLDPFEIFTDDQVWNALELAHLKHFVKGLTAGLVHEISEGGENLSVGQRQLVCLARALLKRTKILVLDEATAAVDLETDDLIQKTIRSEFKDCTVMTIAHRLNTIMDSTRVMVLDKGEIREFDLPETLLKNKKSIFYGMCQDAGLVASNENSNNHNGTKKD